VYSRTVVFLVVIVAARGSHAKDVVLTDPVGDDRGPGGYAYPAVDGFRNGTFDLTSLRVSEGATGLRITATFAGAPETVTVRTRLDSPGRPVFMPVVDVYASYDAVPGHGHTEVLPGRRVAIAGGVGWDRAVVVSAVPDLLEAHYGRVVPLLAADTCFARGAVVTGKTIDVHVPRRCLPRDLDAAGFLVVVTGLGPGAGLAEVVRRLDHPREPDTPDPYVREVREGVGVCNVWEDGAGTSPCSFGGCEPCAFAPFVIDAIVPPGASQEELLKAYDADHRRLAGLPLVFAPGRGPSGPPPGPPPPEPRIPVASARGRELTVKAPEGPGPRFPAGTLGAIICPDGRPGGSVVVKGEAAGFLVLERVGEDSPPCEGAVVAF
jgi:hypothetical protein